MGMVPRQRKRVKVKAEEKEEEKESKIKRNTKVRMVAEGPAEKGKEKIRTTDQTEERDKVKARTADKEQTRGKGKAKRTLQVKARASLGRPNWRIISLTLTPLR